MRILIVRIRSQRKWPELTLATFALFLYGKYKDAGSRPTLKTTEITQRCIFRMAKMGTCSFALKH